MTSVPTGLLRLFVLYRMNLHVSGNKNANFDWLNLIIAWQNPNEIYIMLPSPNFVRLFPIPTAGFTFLKKNFKMPVLSTFFVRLG
jgi:hypothetical protein